MGKDMNSGTPVMRQFWKTKKEHPNSILLFRMGDFYETFEDDAKIASKTLGITLTQRSNGAASDVPLAGFPYHALDQYLHKLLKSGYRVAICEQIGDPKTAKGIVEREVTEVVSPGAALSDNYLSDSENNYLASIVFEKNTFGISILDFSTGEFMGATLPLTSLQDIVYQYKISEIIISESQYKKYGDLINKFGALISEVPGWYSDLKISDDYLKEHFKVKTLKGFGISSEPLLIKSSAFALDYVDRNYKGKIDHIHSFKKMINDDILKLDSYTINNLEIFDSISAKSTDGTLLNIIDKTQTAEGSRLFRKWIREPLTNIQKINSRLDRIDELSLDEDYNNLVIDSLKNCCDISRVTSRVSGKKTNPREILSLASSLEILESLSKKVNKNCNKSIYKLVSQRKSLSKLKKVIKSTLMDDCPVNFTKGNFIRDGVDKELDEYRKISSDATAWLINYQSDIQKQTGINKVKVGYNRVFGYYIEISNANLDKVPDYFIRKQTLTNAERFFTEELKDYESKILSAEEKIIQIELNILSNLIELIMKNMKSISVNAKIIAKLDIASSLSIISRDRNYCRPNFNDNGKINIKDSRHPVIEELMDLDDDFIPNDVSINNQNEQISIITGPNMSGKSTYLRQIGIIIIMAQSGCYVPCTSADISIMDRVFTRVGASDNLVGGESTFLVEMNEAANILNNLSDRSLILLDEIGRGTSTYDGLAIAWAITEHLHNSKYNPITLFATHYHELIDLADKLEHANNYCVLVEDDGEDVVFLRKINEGWIDKSYGIHVAKMAGLPKSVINRSYEILSKLSKETISIDINRKMEENIDNSNDILNRLKDIDVSKITPLEALIKLSEIVEEANEK